jgi:hypothetical protein
MKLNKRALERLEKKRGSVSHPRNDDALDMYFMEVEDFQRAQQGLPPLYERERSEWAESLRNDPELEAYFARLEKQEEDRQRLLTERSRHDADERRG